MRKQGRRGGVLQRLKRQGHRRIPLPTVILANAQSLRNKIDILQANVNFLPEYKNACLTALSETWLKQHDLQSDLDLNGFGEPVRLDRDPTVTGKSLGGGLCLFVNKNWCNSVVVRESLCSPDIELLSVSLRPFYLPREFPQLFVTLVYIHPRANVDTATKSIVDTVHRLQSITPDAPNLIMGDFNQCKPGKSLNNFYQYVTCPTRNTKCLDLCYGSIKGAYKSFSRVPLGMSDHSVVYLVPTYKSVLKETKPERRLVPVWSSEAAEHLKDCFFCTDWDLFKESCSDLDDLTETVTGYINFCEDMIIPKKPINIFSNNKPWLTKSLKNIINLRNISFIQGDETRNRELQKQVKREIKAAKVSYKDKVQTLLKSGNSRPAWEGVKSIMGMNSKKSPISLNGKSDSELANDLNTFYNRFDVHDFGTELSMYKNISPQETSVHIDSEVVLKLSKGIKERKSPGPDNISGRLLKNCAAPLSDIFSFIYCKSLQLARVPSIWKNSVIVPVPKTKHPKSLNDFRPIALTSLAMKAFEKIIKAELLGVTQEILDPFQFAYRPGRGVEDAVATLLHTLQGHLDGAKTFARLLFIDFSSAFNCIQPHILAKRLAGMGIDHGLICWLMDFLTDRLQNVRVNGVLSDILLSSTGSPQGCVLSPLLFSLYTNECQCHYKGRNIFKFADDSAIVSLLSDNDCQHGPVLEDFIVWCKRSFLNINISKTKEMIIDFRRKSPSVPPSLIDGQAVEVVHQYKYLGTIIDDELTFDANTDAVCAKAHQRMYFYRKLRNFNVDSRFMKIFYSSFIESVLTFSFICWFGSLGGHQGYHGL